MQSRSARSNERKSIRDKETAKCKPDEKLGDIFGLNSPSRIAKVYSRESTDGRYVVELAP